MIWIYDNALVNDIKKDLDNNVVVLSPDQAVGVAALLKDDKIHFPFICLTRQPYQLDDTLTNGTKKHVGIPSAFDNKENNFYFEKSIPIKLTYEMTVISPVRADIDELTRELIFKYNDQYFITLQLPYESDRHIRIGVTIPNDAEIDQRETSSTYVESGKLQSAIIPLSIDGAVLLSYTPMHLQRVETMSKDIENNLAIGDDKCNGRNNRDNR